jgi:hypothetical protein
LHFFTLHSIQENLRASTSDRTKLLIERTKNTKATTPKTEKKWNRNTTTTHRSSRETAICDFSSPLEYFADCDPAGRCASGVPSTQTERGLQRTLFCGRAPNPKTFPSGVKCVEANLHEVRLVSSKYLKHLHPRRAFQGDIKESWHEDS